MKRGKRKANEQRDLMKSGAKTAIALFGGTAILSSTVGCGDVSAGEPASRTITTKNRSFSVTPAHSPPATLEGYSGYGGVTSFYGCIIGLNCGCIPHRTCGKQLVLLPPPSQHDSDVPEEELVLP
jgi:hypothetical protein